MAIGNPFTKMFSDKRQWREYQARIAALPRPHREAANAVEHYLLRVGAVFVSEGDALLEMLGDLADLFEQSAADGSTVRAVVGDDPAAFIEDFLSNYPAGQWLTKERTRLAEAIERAEESS